MNDLYRYVKGEWRELWDRKIDDKLVAEAIARREYAVLFVDKGDVISATRRAKAVDLREIVEAHEKSSGERIMPADPAVGGWHKFIKEEFVIPKLKKRSLKRRRREIDRPVKRGSAKKGGRGWLHG